MELPVNQTFPIAGNYITRQFQFCVDRHFLFLYLDHAGLDSHPASPALFRCTGYTNFFLKKRKPLAFREVPSWEVVHSWENKGGKSWEQKRVERWYRKKKERKKEMRLWHQGNVSLSFSTPLSSAQFLLSLLRPLAFSLGTIKEVMALKKTHSLFLLLLLTLLGLGLVQPSYGQDRMYQRFLRQHVDPRDTGGDDNYCNVMMQRRKMTLYRCKSFNTFIHGDVWSIRSICNTSSVQCKNGNMNCHESVVKVTDCKETGSSRAPNCRYRALASTRRVVVACEGNPEVPVHFDR